MEEKGHMEYHSFASGKLDALAYVILIYCIQFCEEQLIQYHSICIYNTARNAD